MKSLSDLQSKLNLYRAQYNAVEDSHLFTEEEKQDLLPTLKPYIKHIEDEIAAHPDNQATARPRREDAIPQAACRS